MKIGILSLRENLEEEETKPESSKIVETDPKHDNSSDYQLAEEPMEEEPPSHSDDSRLFTDED